MLACLWRPNHQPELWLCTNLPSTGKNFHLDSPSSFLGWFFGVELSAAGVIFKTALVKTFLSSRSRVEFWGRDSVISVDSIWRRVVKGERTVCWRFIDSSSADRSFFPVWLPRDRSWFCDWGYVVAVKNSLFKRVVKRDPRGAKLGLIRSHDMGNVSESSSSQSTLSSSSSSEISVDMLSVRLFL